MEPARVLIAEDDPDLRSSLAEVLSEEGMKVVSVGSGSEALSALAESDFDVVVTDVLMPSPAGVQVATMARTAGEDVPFLVITGLRERWIAKTVGQLQRAELLLKPFSKSEFVERVHSLANLRYVSRAQVMTDEAKEEAYASPPLFPPELVSLLRERFAPNHPCIAGISDQVLAELLTVIFFAGLETEEGIRHPVRVVFVGASPLEAEPPGDDGVTPMYRWSPIRFCTPRSFSTRELVRLSAASASARVFIEVQYRDGRLLVAGLAREGVNLEGDISLEIVSSKPGSLSILAGRQHVLQYEHGRVQSGDGDVVLTYGPVYRALESLALAAALTREAVPAYLDAVDSLVAGLSAHGTGGILVVSAEDRPELAGESCYHTRMDVSLVSLIERLHARARGFDVSAPSASAVLEQVVRQMLLAELQRTIQEFAGLTALDGATVLGRSLSLAGFGVVLPVHAGAGVVEARDVEATATVPYDLGTRGTRHRAAATYAREHPGSVVFVASGDGPLKCFLRECEAEMVTMWRLRRSHLHRH